VSARITVVALWLLGCTDEALADANLLWAIGQVEGGARHQVGDGGRSLGLYQLGPEAWAEGNARLRAEGRTTYRRTSWRDHTAQDMVAAAFLRVCRDRIVAAGLEATPTNLALVWNVGFAGAKRRGWQPNGYAYRVTNLCHLNQARAR
jgi:hypothetical protein